MTAISADDLTVRYGETTALDGVSLHVPAARICGLLGMNGSGKSTLFKALMGLITPERGNIRLLNRQQHRARREGLIAYVPQAEAVDRNFPVTVADVVMMGRYGRLRCSRRPRRADREAVHAALDRVGLAELADKTIGTLSGGQRKRAFVARGLAQHARLLFLDEPFAGVDRKTEATITELLRDLRTEGRTMVISTHDVASVPTLCDEALLLHRRVIAHGTPDAVLAPETLARTFGVELSSSGHDSQEVR